MIVSVGIMIPGIAGCSGSTLVAGVLGASQYPEFELGMLTRTEPAKHLKLAAIDELKFAGWDILPANLAERIRQYGILPTSVQQQLDVDRISHIPIYEPVLRFTDYECVVRGKRLSTEPPRKLVDKVRREIDQFMRLTQAQTLVVINLSSPSMEYALEPWHHDLEQFSKELQRGNEKISSAMIYCFASLSENAAYVDFTADRVLECRAFHQLAAEKHVPIAGKDGNTGQTLLKSVLADMLSKRHFRLVGWYSTNILGNNDGMVLSDARFNTAKLEDKRQVLDKYLKNAHSQHVIHISYVEPKGDEKEAWDWVQFEGWLGARLRLRVNWEGSDSLLAAPLLLDLCLLMDYAKRRGLYGIQTQLGVYFKNPIGTSERRWLELHRIFEEFCIKEVSNASHDFGKLRQSDSRP